MDGQPLWITVDGRISIAPDSFQSPVLRDSRFLCLQPVYEREKAVDPVTFVFSAYLNSVQSIVSDHLIETKNAEVTPVVIEYEGGSVSFQHQWWRVRPDSVCANYRQDIAEFSRCTVRASRLFNALCSELSASGSEDWRQLKIRNMYCNAAVSFRPTIANVSPASEKTELEKARQNCNAATVAAMGSRDPKLLLKKKELCDVYREMKAGAGSGR